MKELVRIMGYHNEQTKTDLEQEMQSQVDGKVPFKVVKTQVIHMLVILLMSSWM